MIVDFDENDGQFDHVPPPVPAAGTTGEFYLETSLAPAPLPVGLGFRVPLLLISPWTRGGWVTSEVSDHTSVIQFLEKWTEAIGSPAVCPNISDWRRSVCGDLTGAFDFANPVYGMPSLPDPGQPIGEVSDGYTPVPGDNVMPAQEPGTKRARPLPYQPNANLDGFTFGQGGSVEANLSFSNSGPHVRKASHFSVYDNVAPDLTVADYPARFPGQYTVGPSRASWGNTVAGSVGIGTGKYDITIVGPNRFLRHFTGDVGAPGLTAQARAAYSPHGFAGEPRLWLTLTNSGTEPITFTVTPDHYSSEPVRRYRVPAHGSAMHVADPLADGHGWYDLSVAISSDRSWARRFVGHLEDGNAGVTG